MTKYPQQLSVFRAVERVLAAADKLLDWRGTEGFKIIDPNLRAYVEACKVLYALEVTSGGDPGYHER